MLKSRFEGALKRIRGMEWGWSAFRGLFTGMLLGALVGGVFGAIAGALIGFMVDQTILGRNGETRLVKALGNPENETDSDFFPGSITLAGLSAWWMKRLGGPTARMMDFACIALSGKSVKKSASEAYVQSTLETAVRISDTLEGKRLASAYGRRRDPSCAALPAELLYGLLRESEHALTLELNREIRQICAEASVSEADASVWSRKFYPEYRDPYEILGLREGASRYEAKKNFKRLSRIFHPDANASLSEEQIKASKEAFIAIKEAYARMIELFPEKSAYGEKDSGKQGEGQPE